MNKTIIRYLYIRLLKGYIGRLVKVYGYSGYERKIPHSLKEYYDMVVNNEFGEFIEKYGVFENNRINCL